MQITLRVVYVVALAQGIKVILLPGMHLPGHDQGIGYRTMIRNHAAGIIDKF